MDNQSQLLRINSKFRNDPSHSSTTNFTYSIPSNQSSESVRKIELVSFNMNRHYINPNPKILSEIYAIKRIFVFYNQEKKIKYYFDLHGHVSSRGLFLYANSLDFLPHCENYLLPKIYEINCKYFSLDNCIFSEKSMKSKVCYL